MVVRPGSIRGQTELSRRLNRSRVLFGLALVAACALLAYLFSLGRKQESPERFSTVGDFPAGYVWLNTAEPLSLYDQLSKHVILVLFCEFTSLIDVQELTALQSLSDEFTDSPVAVVVSYANPSRDLDSLTAVIGTWGITFPVVVDGDGGVAENFLVREYPTLLLLETRGRIAARYSADWYLQDLTGLVEDLLSQGIASRSLAHEPYVPDSEGRYVPESLPLE
jgi:hypothetical protein